MRLNINKHKVEDLKKLIFRIFLFFALLICALGYFVLTNYPKQFMNAITHPDVAAQKTWDGIRSFQFSSCSSNVKTALEKAGLVARIPLRCDLIEYIKFGNSDVELMDVRYDHTETDDGDGYVWIPILMFNSGKIYVVSREFDSISFFLIKYVSEQSGISRETAEYALKNYSDHEVIQKDNNYCLQYLFKPPFSGAVIYCPDNEVIKNRIFGQHNFSGAVEVISGDSPSSK